MTVLQSAVTLRLACASHAVQGLLPVGTGRGAWPATRLEGTSVRFSGDRPAAGAATRESPPRYQGVRNAGRL